MRSHRLLVLLLLMTCSLWQASCSARRCQVLPPSEPPVIQVTPDPLPACQLPTLPAPVALAGTPTDDAVTIELASFRALVVYLVRSRAWIEGAQSCLQVRGL